MKPKSKKCLLSEEIYQLIQHHSIHICKQGGGIIRTRSWTRTSPIELLIISRRPIQKEIVKKPTLRSQHCSVNGRRGFDGKIWGGQSRRLFRRRTSESPDVIGQEALEEFQGVGSSESDDGSCLEKGRERTRIIETLWGFLLRVREEL